VSSGLITIYNEDCTALFYDDRTLLDLIVENKPDSSGGVWKKGAASYAESIASLPFPKGATERERLLSSVKNDVKFLRLHPLIRPGIKVTGWIYDLESGGVEKVHTSA
jgi:carbonic anhydrase